MNYVVMVFRKVFGYNEEKAVRHMKEVHSLVGPPSGIALQLAHFLSIENEILWVFVVG